MIFKTLISALLFTSAMVSGGTTRGSNSANLKTRASVNPKGKPDVTATSAGQSVASHYLHHNLVEGVPLMRLGMKGEAAAKWIRNSINPRERAGPAKEFKPDFHPLTAKGQGTLKFGKWVEGVFQRQ